VTPSQIAALKPGDVLVVRMRRGGWLARLGAWAISLGARMEGRPGTWQHVVIVSHRDTRGTLWGIQGQPGVVGWVSLDDTGWLTDFDTLSNLVQPKTADQRYAITLAAQALIGKVDYDWAAIVGDSAQAVAAVAGLKWVEGLWHAKTWGDEVPAHVVCSSLASWAYGRAGLDGPRAGRWCTPGDWAAWIISQRLQVEPS